MVSEYELQEAWNNLKLIAWPQAVLFLTTIVIALLVIFKQWIPSHSQRWSAILFTSAVPGYICTILFFFTYLLLLIFGDNGGGSGEQWDIGTKSVFMGLWTLGMYLDMVVVLLVDAVFILYAVVAGILYGLSSSRKSPKITNE